MRDLLLDSALTVFRERGYADTTLEQVARQAGVSLAMAEVFFADKDQLLNALLDANSPLSDMEAALDTVEGETADDLLRDAMRRMVKVADQHSAFFELAIIDAQANNGSYLGAFSAKLFPKASDLLKRIKATGALRPVSDIIIGRTMVALLMGFLISERAVPQIARVAMRMYPQRAWLDGMIDLLLYGVLEDDAR